MILSNYYFEMHSTVCVLHIYVYARLKILLANVGVTGQGQNTTLIKMKCVPSIFLRLTCKRKATLEQKAH